MVRHTKPLSGGGKDKFLRGVVHTVEGVPDTARQALVRELSHSIAEVRVRRDAYERIRDQPARPASAAVPAHPSPPAPPAPTAKPAFDPFAFSAVAVLTKKGKAALQAEFDKITSVDDLRRLGDAQHLALDPALTDIAAIRDCLVAGAERRIAERKAAAS